MTTQRTTSKRYPRPPRRDTTKRNKAELSPWTLSGAVSALAGCPRTARRKTTRNAGAKALRAGQRDECASCQAAGAIVALAPLSAWTRFVLQTNKQKGTRLEHPARRRTTPSDELSHPRGRRPGAPGGGTAVSDHIEGEIAEIPLAESLDST